ncbi:MAG: DUF294 nucleotidyltransferase-like domain-containing protein [Pyrinomonadaceae bacterium]|nr:DUF294 nucleotidyltransferase-like domain-containing protein [Pyrinomonadaceae bacterium]
MNAIESLTRDLPDTESAERFLKQFGEKNPTQIGKLLKNQGLLSDVLTLVSYSPLLAATILQNPDYLWWLNRHRTQSNVRDKEEILESLGRFALMNTLLEPQILLARFRRRELLRIYLRDIRRLLTIAEITEEISNLADAILEYALRLARQEMDNRFGIPLETDEKNRAKPADFCIVSLGKLGSKELNYSSDIDLLFIYSAEGATSGQGIKGTVTNREYFVKLAEFVTKIVGQQTGEGAAYRVDMRLRPHGRIGALALSLKDTVRYYQTEARKWEKQVLIRSRASAGDVEIFRNFFSAVEDFVFSKNESVENALENVRLSKEKINLEQTKNKGFNVKLGKGGIREIEFIAQALQLAYGGNDEWLRSPHTLISLARLADRRLIGESELTKLFDAYEFLRQLEHILQMEHGLQTHFVPEEIEKKSLVARRINLQTTELFEEKLRFHSEKVNAIFNRVFGSVKTDSKSEKPTLIEETGTGIEVPSEPEKTETLAHQPILNSLSKTNFNRRLPQKTTKILETISTVSPPFAQYLVANPALIDDLPNISDKFQERDYRKILFAEISKVNDFAHRLADFRTLHAKFMLEIAGFDIFEKISQQTAKFLQTKLAEASLETALFITKAELWRKYSVHFDYFPFAVLGLGKLGGRGIDYGSDLDLVLVFDDEEYTPIPRFSQPEFYSRAVEIFVTTLSALTREGQIYRVDLRLRPYGKNGTTSIGKRAFLDYLQNHAAVWEWLAYVKIRSVAGDLGLGNFVETEARKIIHRNAQNDESKLADFKTLKEESHRIRERLREQKSTSKRGREIDIKFGEGGMLDVYFAMRFLQLRDNVPDEPEKRSTISMLERLFEADSLPKTDFENFKNGYAFLSDLDHNLRLTVGRSTRLPLANQSALKIISERMKLASINELLEKLTFHRLNIHSSYENILKNRL